MPELNQDGLEVEVAPGVAVRTPGLTGRVEAYEPSAASGRGAAVTSAAFRDVLARAEMEEQVTIEISGHAETSLATGSRAGGGSDDMVIEVPAPTENFGQALLYVDEAGGVSWHFPQEAGQTLTRGSARSTFLVPRTIAMPPQDADLAGPRGIVGMVGTKILKVLTFRIIDKAAGFIGDKLARRYEDKHRPHRLRTFTPAEFRLPAAGDLGAAGLERVAQGRALLFVHGTMSTSQGGFGTLPCNMFTDLHHRYEGRVFAFDHPTVSVSPTENVAWFAKQLDVLGDQQLTVDIVSHSRGGLVSRLLAEQPGLTGNRLAVERLVMVGTPNAGTALADPHRLGSLLNRMTTMVGLVPSTGVTDALEIILAVVKQVTIGAFKGLDGLMAMDPEGDFLATVLNVPTASTTKYFAAASNFEPKPGTPLFGVARDGVTDLVFKQDHNDLVVPTEGVFQVSGEASLFPIKDPLVFEAGAAVDHSGYWSQSVFTDRLLEWLA